MSSLTSAKAVNIFITGSNRGIGIGLVRELLKQVGSINNLFAGCRRPDEAKELQDLANLNPSVKIVKIDVASDESIKFAADKVNDLVSNQGIHLLINNAGIYEKQEGIDVQKPNRQVFQRHFDINSTGVALVTANFLNLLKTASASGFTPLVINIGSILGCISHTVPISTLRYKSVIYGMSKAALNYYTKALSMEEPEIISVAFHPGWVRTDMGGTDAPLTIEESSSAIVRRICQLKKEDSGNFMDAQRVLTP